MSEPYCCGPRPISFGRCQQLIVEAANEQIAIERHLKRLRNLTASDVRQLPSGDIAVIIELEDGDAIAPLGINPKELVEGEQFLKNTVTVKLLTWLRDSQPTKPRTKAQSKLGYDLRRNKRDS